MARSQYLFSEVFWDIGIGCRYPDVEGRRPDGFFTDCLTAASAEFGSLPIWLAAPWAGCFQLCSALVAKGDNIRVFRLALRADHNASRMGENIFGRPLKASYKSWTDGLHKKILSSLKPSQIDVDNERSGAPLAIAAPTSSRGGRINSVRGSARPIPVLAKAAVATISKWIYG